MKVYNIIDYLEYCNIYPDELHAIDYVPWNTVTYHYTLSTQFIDKYVDYMGWDIITITSSENVRTHFADKINFDLLLLILKSVSMSFIMKHIDRFCISKLSTHIPIDQPFNNDLINRLDWRYISCRVDLTHDFIRMYEQYINFNDVYFPSITTNEDFLDQYHNRLNWRLIAHRQHSPFNVAKYIDSIERYFGVHDKTIQGKIEAVVSPIRRHDDVIHESIHQFTENYVDYYRRQCET